VARIGKIARPPLDIHSQLNSRLHNGAQARLLVQWLNSLPEVKKILADHFDGRPVNEQNLSDWRQGGFEEWLALQDILAHAADLAAHQHELQSAAQGRSLPDHLAASLAFRYAALLASPGARFDEPAALQLKLLNRLTQAVVKLRRSDHNAARLKMETERWEMARRKLEEDKAEADKRKLKETLAAPVWAALKKGKRVVKFGAGKAARLAADYLEEIEKCQDPAHFESKVLSSANLTEMQRYGEELAKKPLVQRTPMQAAIEMDQEMEAYLEARKARREARAARKEPKAARPAKRRPAQKPAKPHKTPPPSTPSTPSTIPPHPQPRSNLESSPPIPSAPPPSGAPGQINPNQV
jgi:hypothetical protein